MNPRAYYNEIDPYAAQWLRNLIAAGHIAPGDVDERSIEDVTPADLAGYTQCHFFAGIGVWSHALRAAGWDDSRPAWTGSCPCQPFSAAGKGAGFADERHLWPAWQHLIAQCRPAVLFGEQVASKDAEPWIDLVHADLEGMGYAFGCVPFPSAGIGAPHIRDRTYWVADLCRQGLPQRISDERVQREALGASSWEATDSSCVVSRLADAYGERAEHEKLLRRAEGPQGGCVLGRRDAAGRLADANGRNASAERQQRSGEQRQQPQDGGARGMGNAHSQHSGRDCGNGAGAEAPSDCGRAFDGVMRYGADLAGGIGNAGATNGFWRAADWLGCTDGKWRPVEPGTFPLAHGAASRVGRLRAYGNAINAEAARQFILAYAEARGLTAVPMEAAA